MQMNHKTVCLENFTGDNSLTGDLTSEDFVTGDVTITAITGDTVTAAISAFLISMSQFVRCAGNCLL